MIDLGCTDLGEWQALQKRNGIIRSGLTRLDLFDQRSERGLIHGTIVASSTPTPTIDGEVRVRPQGWYLQATPVESPDG